ncbi:MAG: hypothetical protein UY27_C0001G0010 [Candidatus Gottesmanbacteria bacterium GW2011_GWA1_48_13]|uniref:Prepilin-type N-terminal cleavage/methylation domain-containing protein n=1 Tax=Candidatus Gottesmanbacteria bacterium GW2011_GWA1_48_13 TaxID=1618439 RepID=A0A0G1UQ09_9BACT|nr:MAG: hypothetical protein UY27_C0001G0010 [Candidatus Gottesmanbacteria bacterium GW2011_GWA1_48_13]
MKKQKGFTLLEILVAIGILAIVGTLIVQVFFTTTRANSKTEVQKNVKQNGDFAIEAMSRLIRSARSVSSSCTAGGATTESLTLINEHGRTTTFGCLLDGEVTRVASTSGARTDYLTDQNLTLGGASCTQDSLQFVCTAPADQPAMVSITFGLSQKGTPPDQFEKASASFQTTVAIRNPAP